MKTSAKVRSLMLIAALAIGLTGCGERAAQTDPPPETPVASTEITPTPEPIDSSSGAPEAGVAAEGPSESDVAIDAVPADRALPDPPPAADESATTAGSEETPDVSMPETNVADASSATGFDENKPTAEELARKAFMPPPDSKSLSESGRLWIDATSKRVYLDGYVALKSGPLEMFACPVGTKEHESIVAAFALSREVHAALLAIGATPGAPVKFQPEFTPPTGQVIRVWVCWYDEQGQFQFADAREWIGDLETEKTMTAEWVFAGSGFWEDPEDKREYYLADSGDMICVSNFASAMMDVAIPSSADTGALRFVPYESKIPEPDTPVRLVLTPVPMEADASGTGKTQKELTVPTVRDLPRGGSSN